MRGQLRDEIHCIKEFEVLLKIVTVFGSLIKHFPMKRLGAPGSYVIFFNDIGGLAIYWDKAGAPRLLWFYRHFHES